MNAKFTVTERDGKLALWVEVDEQKWNIWDIRENEFTWNVQKAIIYAFHRGCLLQRIFSEFAIKGSEIGWSTGDKFRFFEYRGKGG